MFRALIHVKPTKAKDQTGKRIIQPKASTYKSGIKIEQWTTKFVKEEYMSLILKYVIGIG